MNKKSKLFSVSKEKRLVDFKYLMRTIYKQQFLILSGHTIHVWMNRLHESIKCTLRSHVTHFPE